MKPRSRFLFEIAKLLIFAEKEGIELICVDFDRTEEEQRKLVELGRSQIMNSKHLKWLAMDLVVVNGDGSLQWDADGRYQKLGEFWEGLGHIWGGRWSRLHDVYHFELE